MLYVKKTFIIKEEQGKCIEQHNLKLSKVTQKAIEETIHREAQV